ncbi:MAG: quinohemoprotein amine dehydrogenase subunit alpha, partial [Alphaproteobacteria bacterium]|nr:quinohemoprotein amine dehydrogenase subunit alpha [Alphaproteobacteria bacterium]
MRAVEKSASLFGVLAFGLLLIAPGSAGAQDDQALLKEQCASCHEARGDGTLSRVHDARKTPEAWDMTLVRMMNVHGVELSSKERRRLVKHLSDARGLAPAETAGYRYVLEKTPGVTDTGPSDDLTQICGRCHTFARVGLQRRDEVEWLKLVHFHLGQFPTTEYQALGRDRDWWGIASTGIPKELAKLYPLETDAWTSWQKREAPDLSGAWRLVGRQPGKGPYDGRLTVKSKGGDNYEVESMLTFAGGETVKRRGRAILYTGHEWRAATKAGDDRIRQVASVAEDGNSMSGRWFRADNDVVGGTMTAVRMKGAAPQILAVAPDYLKQGGSAQIVV